MNFEDFVDLILATLALVIPFAAWACIVLVAK